MFGFKEGRSDRGVTWFKGGKGMFKQLILLQILHRAYCPCKAKTASR